MRSSVSLFALYCLLSRSTESWSFTPNPSQSNGRKMRRATTTSLDLFRRSRLNVRSLAGRVDDYKCTDTSQRKKLGRNKNNDSVAEMLRSAVVTGADGTVVRLGDKMGEGRAVIVFLRHLGCPYCWSYAREWSKLQRRIARSGATGPFFVSVGDCEKLQTFLQLNRNIPRKQSFVDDTSLHTYESIGLRSMEFGKTVDDLDVDVEAPKLGGLRGWYKYMSSAEELTPIEAGSRKFSDGIKQLGGTFIIDGDEVLWEWYDRCPGDTPVLGPVLDAYLV